MGRHRSPVAILVDDEPQVREVLAQAVMQVELTSKQAASAEEAIELLEHSPTPVLVTDLHMPGKGGLWLVHEVRRRWPEIEIIVLTGDQERVAAIQCLHAGAFRFLTKPVQLDELAQALRQAWETFQMRRERRLYQERLEDTVRRQTRRIRARFLSAIESLVRVQEHRDPYTSGHSFRVREYALDLGRALGLPRSELVQISLAAKLHDIGKIGVAEAILLKDSALTEEELREMRRHPVIGEEILRPILRNNAVLGAIRWHHERPDGHGYPDGLAGDAIPPIARIISVADCFDALTTHRSYRRALSIQEASEILADGAGIQLDAQMVHAFLDLKKRGPRFAHEIKRRPGIFST